MKTARQLVSTAGFLLLAVTVSACKDLQEGVEAYHSGEYEKALTHLEKVKRSYRMDTDDISKPFKFDVKLREKETLRQVTPDVTDSYFQFWQAYTGSLYGLGRLAEGCTANERALRPLLFMVDQPKQRLILDPKYGDAWQAEVFTLRAWALNIRCPFEGGLP